LTRAQSALLRRLLDVLDDLERVTHHKDPKGSAQALAEGVELVERKFRQLLESEGDPTTMEGVASVPTENPQEDDTVSDVFQKGYRYLGVLLRPARVRVRKYE
jgi:molecular chaperone GrpE